MKKYGSPTKAILLFALVSASLAGLLGCGQSDPPAALGAPSGLRIENPTTSSLDISWDAVAGAASYELFRAGSSSGPWTSSVHDGTGTSWTDSGLTPATTYYYAVRAANTDETSPLSSPVPGTTAAGTPTWKLFSLSGIPSTIATEVQWIDLHQATVPGALSLVVGSNPSSGRGVYAYKGDDGSWTDITEATPPSLLGNAGSLVSCVSPAGEPSYWYQGMGITGSQVRSYSGSAWAAVGGSPAPSTSVGEYRYLYYSSTGNLRLLYQEAAWDNPSQMYKQNIRLREYGSGWAAPAGTPEPIAAISMKTQTPKLRAAIGAADQIHFAIVKSLDGTTATVDYYMWDGALTGPETIASTNPSTVVAIAVNPVNGRPCVIAEDVGTSGSTRALTAYTRTGPNSWSTVGAAGALTRTTFNNSSCDLAFTAAGTLWAAIQTDGSALSAFRYASAWNQYSWAAGTTINYKGMKLLKDGRICLFSKPNSGSQSLSIAYLDTW